MEPSSLDVGGAEAVDQGNREITEGGQNLGSIAGAQAGAIFSEGHIAHIMRTVLIARQEGSLPPARLQNRT